VSPWVRLLTDAIRAGQEAGRVRADVDPEAWLIEVVVLVLGTYAAADLASTVFPQADSGGSGQHTFAARQLQEITRIARTSLFVPSEVAR
jgi:hypothetical protein